MSKDDWGMVSDGHITRIFTELHPDEDYCVSEILCRIRKDPDLFFVNLTHERIALTLNDRSMCELDEESVVYRSVLSEYGIEVPEDRPIFWFTRLKVTTEHQGYGTKLLGWLEQICDALGWCVINQASPYGVMNLKDLTLFYQRHGFDLIYKDKSSNLMYRCPKIQVLHKSKM